MELIRLIAVIEIIRRRIQGNVPRISYLVK